MSLSSLRVFLLFVLTLAAPCVTTAQDGHYQPAKPGTPRLVTDLSPRYYPYQDREHYPERLLVKLNEIRKLNRLPALRLAPALNEVAQAHSMDMYLRNFVDHVSPDKEDHAGRLARLKPRMLMLQSKENLAWYEATFLISEADLIAKEFEGLMNSPAHRDAILSKDVSSVGFGYTTYWNGERFESNQVQLFADIVGEWRQDVPAAIQPGQTYELALARPIDVFLASETNPKGQFDDSFNPNKKWFGGLPVPFLQGKQVPTLRIPNVPPGNYRIQCSAKDANRYVIYKRVRVDRIQ